MSADQLSELLKLVATAGPTPAILLYMFFSRNKAPSEGPANDLIKELSGINARLAAVEAILDERKGK